MFQVKTIETELDWIKMESKLGLEMELEKLKRKKWVGSIMKKKIVTGEKII